MTVRTIDIARIDAGDRLRTLDPAWVALLAEEIAADGQNEPIRVVSRGDGFRLVSGARRVAALLALGREEVLAIVERAETLPDAAAVRLAEIKGHLLRGDLTALDHARTVAAWCDLYQVAVGPSKPGPKPATAMADEALEEFSANLALNWTEAAQNALRIGRRSVFRALKIAAIDDVLVARIALLPVARKQTELLLLADQTPARQAALVDLLAAEPARATSVTEAIALYDSVPAPKKVAAYERLYERFSDLKQPEQEKFFELNRRAIETWIAKREAARGKAAA